MNDYMDVLGVSTELEARHSTVVHSGDGLYSSHGAEGTIRLGIIGCGAITANAHLPAALSSSLVEITALSDADSARLRYIQRQCALESVGFVDYRDTFPHVDAVILAVPNHLHAPIGHDFLSHGIHVLCEKPLAMSRTECDYLCVAARATNSVLSVGYYTRFFPSTELTKKLIDSGFLGRLYSFDYEFGTEGGWAPLSGYNLTRTTSGGGVLVVSGTHFIDRMLYLFGDVEVLSYADDNRGGVEANCVAVFNCNRNGEQLQGRVTLSKTHKLANRLRIVGDKGFLQIAEGQSDSVTFFPAQSELRYEILYAESNKTISSENYYKVELEDFIRAVQTKTEPLTNGEQGALSVAIIEKCYQIATGLEERWVDATLQRLKLPTIKAEDSST
jgi:predicted dehydrogenase